MDSNPLLSLLVKEEEPHLRTVLSTTTAIVKHPRHLTDLLEHDLFENLLALLETRISRFKRIFTSLRDQVEDKSSFFRQISPFVRQLLDSAREVVNQDEYQDLVCTVVQLCSDQHERLRILIQLAAYDQTLELLTVSLKGSSLMLDWVESFNEDTVNVTTLEDWTRRIAALVESCERRHGLSTVLSRWQKLEVLKQVLRIAIEADDETIWISTAKRSVNTPGNEIIMDPDTVRYFTVFKLPIPRSQRMCRNHLHVLCQHESMRALKELLVSYPCGRCQRRLQHGPALPPTSFAPDHDNSRPVHLHDPLLYVGEGIGAWTVVLSARAYRNLRAFESDDKIQKTLETTFAEMASGTAKFIPYEIKSKPSRVLLRATKWHARLYFLWQHDIAPGPEANLEQQIIKVWAVGSRQNLNTMLDEIRQYQESFSEIRVTRCLDEAPTLEGRRQPKIYDEAGAVQDLQAPADLDIRLMDQQFIDTYNKSFTVTDSLLKSIIEHDMTAEFPFDVSQNELQIIQHTSSPTLIMGRSGTGKTTCLLYKMVAKYVTSCTFSPQRPNRQVLLTRSETLAEKLRDYSRKLISALSQKTTLPTSSGGSQPSDRRSLVDLEDSDFPLVCGYEEFLAIFEAAIDTLDRKAFHQPSEASKRNKIVNYTAFRKKYWPHFPADLTKGLSAPLVFSEIMGTIKGSTHTYKTLSHLQSKEYQDLSTRVAPNFASASDRLRVYRIFKAYEKLKYESRELDAVDWVIGLLRRLNEDADLKVELGSYVDEVYVDEVQDLRCIDVALLLGLSHDPRSFHFGGDTAQAISQDSTFRFQDVKALFYDRFHRQSVAIGQESLAQPQTFTLIRNYRSHRGILSVASTVMHLLWRNFPDTVDKSPPEVGTLVGPSPILFLGCDASILMRNTAEATVSPQHELLFGAEQVILTRDDDSKAKLVESIKDALILTILQAKGMEFDDVILWDFFTTTTDLPGWRSLEHSVHEGAPKLDGIKHAGLCSELKHLYVAITRARVQLLMIETSEEIPQPFLKLMNKPSAPQLIEVTSSSSDDFRERIKALEPRKSDDPQRWCARGEQLMAQALYKEASICFRNADQPLKQKTAEAYLEESSGEELYATDKAKSRYHLEAAIAAFQGLKMVSEAARLLVRLQRVADAAEYLSDQGYSEKAAVLFEKVSEYKRASVLWHSLRKYNRAVTCLRDGVLHDEMVHYLMEQREFFSSQEIRRHQLATKLLLKQRKISPKYRSDAIGILGFTADQEVFYKEYDMTDELLEFYKEQKAHPKLLLLLLKLDRLEDALEVTSMLSCRGVSIIGEAQLSQLVSTIWVDRICMGSADYRRFNSTDSWQQAFDILRSWDHLDSQRQILAMDDRLVAKAFLCFYVVIHMEKVVSISTFDEIPFELLYHSLELIKAQQPEPHGVAGEALLLVSGVFRGFEALQHYSLRIWSPLRGLQKVQQGSHSLHQTAMGWAIHQISQTVIHVDELSRNLYRQKWRTRCSFFLVTGYCRFRDEPRGCPFLHEQVTDVSYSKTLEDMILVVRSLCGTTTLFEYRESVMSEQVSKKFLGARRHWLEKLTAALSFISGFEQDSRIIELVWRRIREDHSLKTITSCLEEHLLYRARQEWTSKASLGYVREQVDLAAHLGESVKDMLIGRTRDQICYEYPVIYIIMVLSDRLLSHTHGGSAYQYRDALGLLLNSRQGIMNLKWQAFESFHCHTSFFEATALYPLLQVSSSSIIVPRSWLDLHLAAILSRDDLSKTPSMDQRQAYRDALILLLKSFVQLLQWLDEPLQVKGKFLLSGQEYPIRLLQQRNCEFLLVILVNLLAIPQLSPPNLETDWRAILKVLGLPTVKANHLKHSLGREDELRSKLLESHQRYNGKNPLMILNITIVEPHRFTAFQQAHNITSEHLGMLRNRHLCTKSSETAIISDTEQAVEGLKVKQAALRIWQNWLKYSPRIKARKAFANTVEGRIVSKLHNLCPKGSSRVRPLLLHLGVKCLLQLGRLSLSVAELKTHAVSKLDEASIENSEELYTVIENSGNLEEDLKRHHERLSDETLAAFVAKEKETAPEKEEVGSKKEDKELETDVSQAKKDQTASETGVKSLKELLQKELARMEEDEQKATALKQTLESMV